MEQQSGAWQSPYLFNAKELDSETGLYYYGARYLDPSEGMWLSVDPLWEKYVGMSPYGYCAGNPVGLVDPDGNGVYACESEDGSTSYVILSEEDTKKWGDTYKNEFGKYKKNSDGFDIDNIKKDEDKVSATKRNEQTSGMMIFGMSDKEDKSVNDRAKHQDKSIDSSDMNLGWNISNFSIKKWFKSLFSSSQEEKSSETKVSEVTNNDFEEHKPDTTRIKIKTEYVGYNFYMDGPIGRYRNFDTINFYQVNINGVPVGVESDTLKANRKK